MIAALRVMELGSAILALMVGSWEEFFRIRKGAIQRKLILYAQGLITVSNVWSMMAISFAQFALRDFRPSLEVASRNKEMKIIVLSTDQVALCVLLAISITEVAAMNKP